MPRDIFGSVTDPSVRGTTRKWSTVGFSFTAHALVLMLLVVVPLMAAGVLPVPKSGPIMLSVQPVVVPEPPTPIRHDSPQPPADTSVAPVVAPDGVASEREPPGGFETSVPDVGIVEAIGTNAIEEFVPAPPPVPLVPQPALHVGGTVKTPTKIHDVLPTYPPIAMAARIEGVVIVEATIGADGRVLNARLLRGIPLLEEAALNAVRQWVYTPTLLNGVPVPVIMTVTVQFTLR